MKVLIDTHCWLWLCGAPERFAPAILARMSEPRTVRLLSAASIWELVIKHRLGKLSLPLPPRDFVPSRLDTTRTQVLEVSAAHALRVSDLPPHHRDPFDRMIVAQALTEGAQLLTADKAIDAYAVEILKPT